MNHLTIALITEMMSISGTIISTILMRWLMGISTYEKDIHWLKKQKIYQYFVKLKYYRGKEYIYQLRARKLLS